MERTREVGWNMVSGRTDTHRVDEVGATRDALRPGETLRSTYQHRYGLYHWNQPRRSSLAYFDNNVSTMGEFCPANYGIGTKKGGEIKYE